MAYYQLYKDYFEIQKDGTFSYLGKLIKHGIIFVDKNITTCKYTFSKNPFIDMEVIVVNYITGTFKEIEPKIIYTQEEKVAYEKEKERN